MAIKTAITFPAPEVESWAMCETENQHRLLSTFNVTVQKEAMAGHIGITQASRFHAKPGVLKHWIHVSSIKAVILYFYQCS